DGRHPSTGSGRLRSARHLFRTRTQRSGTRVHDPSTSTCTDGALRDYDRLRRLRTAATPTPTKAATVVASPPKDIAGAELRPALSKHPTTMPVPSGTGGQLSSVGTSPMATAMVRNLPLDGAVVEKVTVALSKPSIALKPQSNRIGGPPPCSMHCG